MPTRLWYYRLKYVAEIVNVAASNSVDLNGRTPIELISGETPDMSKYLDFIFYERVWFREHSGLAPTNLGRFLRASGTEVFLISY